MTIVLRKLANWLEVKRCNIQKGWNNFLENRKVEVKPCKNCVCEK